MKLTTANHSEITLAPNDDLQLLPLKPSKLRPHCPASDWVHCWKPQNAWHALDDNRHLTNLAENDLAKISKVLKEAFTPNTRSTYGMGLLMFHLFCDHKGIKEEHWVLVNPTVLTSFISTLAGTCGSSTIRNYIYGVRAWHIVHSIKWNINSNKVEALFKAGNKMSPKEAWKGRKNCGQLNTSPKSAENSTWRSKRHCNIHLPHHHFLGNSETRQSNCPKARWPWSPNSCQSGRCSTQHTWLKWPRRDSNLHPLNKGLQRSGQEDLLGQTR